MSSAVAERRTSATPARRRAAADRATHCQPAIRRTTSGSCAMTRDRYVATRVVAAHPGPRLVVAEHHQHPVGVGVGLEEGHQGLPGVLDRPAVELLRPVRVRLLVDGLDASSVVPSKTEPSPTSSHGTSGGGGVHGWWLEIRSISANTGRPAGSCELLAAEVLEGVLVRHRCVAELRARRSRRSASRRCGRTRRTPRPPASPRCSPARRTPCASRPARTRG